MTKIITFQSQKGGTGKSTLAFNIANNISENSKVGVIDYDVQGSLNNLKELVVNFDIIPYLENIEDIKTLDYDFILIDSPPYLSNYLPRLIQISDLVITPIKPAVLDLMAIRSTLELIEENSGTNKTLIVFNMVKANTTLTLDILIGLEEYDVKIANTHISDLVAFTRSVLLQGVTNDKKAQKQLDNLTKEILTKLI